MDRRALLAGGVLLAVAAGAALWSGGLSGKAPAAVLVADVSPAETSGTGAVSAGKVVVHVAGWVVRPGLVEVDRDARVADAVAAAGGARPGAALASLNLAAPIADGEQVVVPGPEGTTAIAGVDGGPVHLNQATATDLERLPGVGPVLAQRIVDHRDRLGPFRSVEDLLDVPGIGEAKLAAIRDEVAVP